MATFVKNAKESKNLYAGSAWINTVDKALNDGSIVKQRIINITIDGELTINSDDKVSLFEREPSKQGGKKPVFDLVIKSGAAKAYRDSQANAEESEDEDAI